MVNEPLRKGSKWHELDWLRLRHIEDSVCIGGVESSPALKWIWKREFG